MQLALLAVLVRTQTWLIRARARLARQVQIQQLPKALALPTHHFSAPGWGHPYRAAAQRQDNLCRAWVPQQRAQRAPSRPTHSLLTPLQAAHHARRIQILRRVKARACVMLDILKAYLVLTSRRAQSVRSTLTRL